MKILQRYLLGQVILSMLLTACVFTFVLLIGTVLKELLPLVVSGTLSFTFFGQALLLLIPFLWVFAMPMGMLTATLLVFGRFSADQELTAARASGVSLLSLILPILLFSLVLCGVSAYVNTQLAPMSRVAYNALRNEVRPSLVKLPERRPIKEIPNHVIYIGRNRNGVVEDILVFQYKNETNLEQIIEAKYGELKADPTNQTLVLQLHDATGVLFHGENASVFLGNFGGVNYVFDTKSQRAAKRTDISDLTILELRRELREMEKRISLPLALPEEGQKKALKRKPSDITEPYRVHMHRQVAFSFACFGFTLVGIPLGIRMHRRETNVGIAIALGLVLIYYSLIIVAQAMSSRSDLAPHLLMWVPNILFQAVGAVLLWRANKGL